MQWNHVHWNSASDFCWHSDSVFLSPFSNPVCLSLCSCSAVRQTGECSDRADGVHHPTGSRGTPTCGQRHGQTGRSSIRTLSVTTDISLSAANLDCSQVDLKVRLMSLDALDRSSKRKSFLPVINFPSHIRRTEYSIKHKTAVLLPVMPIFTPKATFDLKFCVCVSRCWQRRRGRPR